MTTYRITGGIFLILMGLSLMGVASLGTVTGVFGLIAGIALLAGL